MALVLRMSHLGANHFDTILFPNTSSGRLSDAFQLSPLVHPTSDGCDGCDVSPILQFRLLTSIASNYKQLAPSR